MSELLEISGTLERKEIDQDAVDIVMSGWCQLGKVETELDFRSRCVSVPLFDRKFG